jgi:SNF2 family DNA or RNA helicase
MYAHLLNNEIVLGSERGGEWCRDLAWNEQAIAETVPGYGFRTKTKIHHVPLSWASMIVLRGLFGQRFSYTDDLAKWTWDVRATRIDIAMALRDVLEAPVDEHDPLSARMLPFQRAGLNFMLAAQSGLLGDEAGTGKTVQLLSLLRVHTMAYDEGLSDSSPLPALVVSPNSVKHHWHRLAGIWLPQCVPYVIEGKDIKAKRAVIAEAKADPSALLITNIESTRMFSRLAPYGSIALKRCRECDPRYGDDISSSRCHVHPKELNTFGFKTVIIDEIHRAGDPTSQQTRALWSIAHGPTVERRWGATGTPDNISRLWSIMYTIAPDDYATRSKWMDRYALMAFNYEGGLDVVGIRPETRDEAFRVLHPRFRRMLKAIVLPQLPPLVREIRNCTMRPADMKAYKELDTHLHTRLPDGSMLIAKNRLVARTRLMQFASASVDVNKIDPDDISTWEVEMKEPSAKLDVLEEVLDELGTSNPFVVACVNRDLVRLASERLGRRNIRHAMIMNGVSPRERVEFCEQLKTGELKALVFTIASGKEGLDMSGADTLIFLQRSWSLIEDIQTEERINRIGSEIHQGLRVIDIVTDGTVEVDQVERLHEKLLALDEITQDRLALAKRFRELDPNSHEFRQLVGRMEHLTQKHELMISHDDLEVA